MKELTLRPGAVLLAGALAGASASAAEPLRVGLDTRSPPWAFVPGLDYSQEDAAEDPAISKAQLRDLVGLDVDVAHALGRRLGMPVRFGSCHTAVVERYAIEGHVPAKDIYRLLDERPEAIGLSVPAMPRGSPGMDGPVYGGVKDPYDVLLIGPDGKASVFQTYR